MQSTLTLAHAIDGFIIFKRANGLSENTARIYRWSLGFLLAWHGDQSVSTLTPPVIQSFFIYLESEYRTPRGHTLAPTSRQNVWVCLSSFSAWSKSELQITLVIPARPRGQSPEITPFTDDEMRRLLSAAAAITVKTDRHAYRMKRPTALRDVALLTLLLDSGLRVGEACRLQVRDVDLDSGQIIVMPYGTGRKTKRRIAQIGRATIRALWRLLAARPATAPAADLLFATLSTGKPLTATAVNHLFRHIGQRAHVANVHPHRFRHTFAIQYLRNGGDVFTLQRLLGHSSLDMVRRYVALADADTAAVHQRASPADRWKL